MLENIYTTKMSANKKQLQNRFTKIRSSSGRISKMMSFIMAIFVAVTMLCATVVMAAVVNEEENFFINGKGYAITPILIENKLEVHTDSYYIPLRDTFEALGYDVFYDVDKSKYESLMDEFVDASKVIMEESVIPELDAYRFAKIASNASLSKISAL